MASANPAPSVAKPGEAPAFRRSLLAWYRKAQRPLPWRHAPTPYRTAVSEFMLQQTQVATVIPYFERWVARWPTFKHLAQAKEHEVLAAWAGLGYYRRARLLHALAQAVVALPKSPQTAAAWQQLPGVGPYTAAAIGSIAYGDPVAVVDGNVVRVVTRLLGLRRTFASTADAVRAVTPQAQALLSPSQPGDYNQAIMELGATVCRKAAPTCEVCPIARWCASRGQATAIPKFMAKARKRETVERALIVVKGKVLLRRYPQGAQRLAGLAELPTMASLGHLPQTPIAIRRRTITSTTYEERLHQPRAKAAYPKREGLVWVALTELPFAAVAGPHLKWIKELLS